MPRVSQTAAPLMPLDAADSLHHPERRGSHKPVPGRGGSVLSPRQIAEQCSEAGYTCFEVIHLAGTSSAVIAYP